MFRDPTLPARLTIVLVGSVNVTLPILSSSKSVVALIGAVCVTAPLADRVSVPPAGSVLSRVRPPREITSTAVEPSSGRMDAMLNPAITDCRAESRLESVAVPVPSD